MLDNEVVTHSPTSVQGKTLASAVNTTHVHRTIRDTSDQKYNIIKMLIYLSIQEHTDMAYRSVRPAKRRKTRIELFESKI